MNEFSGGKFLHIAPLTQDAEIEQQPHVLASDL